VIIVAANTYECEFVEGRDEADIKEKALAKARKHFGPSAKLEVQEFEVLDTLYQNGLPHYARKVVVKLEGSEN
jgi:hypothetical protein